MTAVSPLAPKSFPNLAPLAGVRLAVAEANVKYKGRTDVLLAELDHGTTVAGVFTKSKTASAPVEWCREHVTGGAARALLVNSGNANAFTGKAGAEAMMRTIEAAADQFPCRPSTVFCASTGVIGEVLNDQAIVNVLPDLGARLDSDVWAAAAEAIMTTDTFPKGATRTAEIDGKRVTINGIAKGSGMIAPDMATMLCFVFTDAAIPASVLQDILSPAVDKTFNAITVDSDTSTSDTVMVFATGQAGNVEPETATSPSLDGFKTALEDLLRDLAHQVVRDGEGATKFVSISVAGAEDDAAARRMGLAIANSPLVKTAIAGEDANWGRVVMAIGKAGEKADRDKICIRIGGVLIAENGGPVPGYDEGPVAQHMRGQEIQIAVEVGISDGEATVWTCDLTHGYITINADYRS